MQRHDAGDNGEEPVLKKHKIEAARKPRRPRKTRSKKVRKTKTVPTSFAYFPALPVDLQRHVSSFLPLTEYPNIASTSKGFYSIANGPHFWLNKFQKHFPDNINAVRRTKRIAWNTTFQPESPDGHDQPPAQSFAAEFNSHRTSKISNVPYYLKDLFLFIREDRHDEIDMARYDLDDLNTTSDSDNQTPAMLAAQRNNQAVLDIFYQKAIEYYQEPDDDDIIDPEKTDSLNQTILHWALICKQSIDDIAALIALGCDVSAPDHDDWTPLHLAAISNHTAAINLLITHGADPNEETIEGATALHFAARYGQTATIVTLLANRAEVDKANVEGATALLFASRFNNLECVNVLLKHGANVNFVHDSPKQYTALHCAAERGNLDIIKVLLEAGAKADARTKAGYTALEFAILYGHHECADHLIGHNLDLATQLSHDGLPLLCVAAGSGYINCIRVLLRRGADVNALSSGEAHSTSPLIQAALHGDINCLLELIAAGAKIDLECDYGYTPLLAAVENGNTACVKLLLDLGANPNCHEKESGMTALMTAANEGHTECMRLLLDKGANTEACDFENKWPALFFAVNSDQVECVKLLHERGADITLEVEKSKEELQQTAASSYSKFHLLAVLRKFAGERKTITAEELAKMLGHKQIAAYLENVRLEKLEKEADELRAFW
jgi:ankyrin repeat protein